MPRFSVKSITFCALFASLIMAGAMIRVPLPYIPFTLQTLFVFLAGLVLGPKLGLYAALLYMVAGLIGLPVFANGGGFMYVLQPSFGYILSFCPTAYLIGKLSQKRPGGSVFFYARCCLAGLVIIYLIGVSYLSAIMLLYLKLNVSFLRIITIGALVFLPGDCLACFTAAWLFSKLPQSLLPKQL